MLSDAQQAKAQSLVAELGVVIGASIDDQPTQPSFISQAQAWLRDNNNTLTSDPTGFDAATGTIQATVHQNAAVVAFYEAFKGKPVHLAGIQLFPQADGVTYLLRAQVVEGYLVQPAAIGVPATPPAPVDATTPPAGSRETPFGTMSE